jgi:hypothetical protein
MSGRRSWLCLGLAVPVLLFALAAAPAAHAANELHYTLHLPADVYANPCFPADVLNLNGDIHIVMTTTTSGAGYRVNYHLNSQFSGTSITTGTKYVHSAGKDESFFASPPFPFVHTHTEDFVLLSQSSTPNFVMHVTMHETVTPTGMPTAAVDRVKMDCQG